MVAVDDAAIPDCWSRHTTTVAWMIEATDRNICLVPAFSKLLLSTVSEKTPSRFQKSRMMMLSIIRGAAERVPDACGTVLTSEFQYSLTKGLWIWMVRTSSSLMSTRKSNSYIPKLVFSWEQPIIHSFLPFVASVWLLPNAPLHALEVQCSCAFIWSAFNFE